MNILTTQLKKENQKNQVAIDRLTKQTNKAEKDATARQQTNIQLADHNKALERTVKQLTQKLEKHSHVEAAAQTDQLAALNVTIAEMSKALKKIKS